MTYRITNKSHQEGMISLNGSWVTVSPGQVLYESTMPGAKTNNITISKIVDAGANEAVQQPRPSSNIRNLVNQTPAPSADATKVEAEKEDKTSKSGANEGGNK